MRLTHLVVLGLVLGAGAGWWLRRDAPPQGTMTVPPAVQGTVATASAGHPPAPHAVAPATAAGAVASAPPAVPQQNAAQPAQAPMTSHTADAPAGLLLPVQGVSRSDLRDTFTDARSEGRVHDAIDIMAATGTPVLAVADGPVEKLFDSERGGLTIYQFDPSGRWCYYYAHLDRYADGLAEKKMLTRGEVIGYVGATGNARADAPHLHFEVHVLGPEKQWWKGESINPYPLLR